MVRGRGVPDKSRRSRGGAAHGARSSRPETEEP